MSGRKMGIQTMAFPEPISILGRSAIGGKREGEGPLGVCFDRICPDDRFGEDTWEQSERAMQEEALAMAIERAGVRPDWLFAGDLLNQCTASSFSARSAALPYFGLYGACSTVGEGLTLAAMALSGGFGRWAGVVTSSHFCCAERQYRVPLEYGGQRPPTAQWTVTAAGAFVLGREGQGPCVTHATVGKVTDLGVTDTNNMGAAMAPAAHDTISAHFADTGRSLEDYDLIVTGDLGQLGSQLLEELFRRDGVDLASRHTDCGLLIYDPQRQDVHCGGSGCGCSACVLAGYLLGKQDWNRMLFCPTGALHSPVTAFQKESIPGICHAISISREREV